MWPARPLPLLPILLLQEKQHERALYASELQRALQHPALQPKFVPMYEKELQARHRQP